MSEIRNLTRNGETFYPLTCSDAVLNRDGEPLGLVNDIFDISEYNASGTPSILAKYDNLSLALAAVPTSKQKGGMTIRYVQTSGNKYIQYRLTSNTFTTTESEWQKQGAEVTVSQNTSTGNKIAGITIGATEIPLYERNNGFYKFLDGNPSTEEISAISCIKSFKIYVKDTFDKTKRWGIRQIGRNQTGIGYRLILISVASDGSQTGQTMLEADGGNVTENNGETIVTYNNSNFSIIAVIDFSLISDGGYINTYARNLHWIISPDVIVDDYVSVTSLYPATSKSIKNKLDESAISLQSEIRRIVNITELSGAATLYMDGYTLAPNGTYEQTRFTTIFGCYKLDVADIPENDVLSIIQYANGVGYCLCGAFDENDNFIEDIKSLGVQQTTIETFIYSFEVKSNYSYLIFTQLKANWGNLTKMSISAVQYGLIKDYVDPKINHIQYDVNIKSLATLYKDGYVLNPDGTYGTSQFSSEEYGCYKLDVSDIPNNEIISVQQYISGYGYVACGAFDENDNFIESLHTTISDDNLHTIEYDFQIKNDYSYIVFTQYKADWSTDKTLIGSTDFPVIKKWIGLIMPSEITVNPNGGADFTKITDAIAYANLHPNTTIRVYPAVYDFVTELGTTYFDAVTDTYYEGLLLGNGVNIIADGNGVIFKLQYQGENFYVGKQLSLFNVNGTCRVEGVDFIGENIRYIIHDDVPTSRFPDATAYKVEFVNCTFNHKGSTMYDLSQSIPIAVGGGCHNASVHFYDGCIFKSESVTEAVDLSYHTSEVCASKVILKNNYFINGKSYNSRQFMSFTGIIDIFLSNNRFGGALQIQDVQYITVTEFGNIIYGQ